jgi:hypothetical protein
MVLVPLREVPARRKRFNAVTMFRARSKEDHGLLDREARPGRRRIVCRMRRGPGARGAIRTSLRENSAPVPEDVRLAWQDSLRADWSLWRVTRIRPLGNLGGTSRKIRSEPRRFLRSRPGPELEAPDEPSYTRRVLTDVEDERGGPSGRRSQRNCSAPRDGAGANRANPGRWWWRAPNGARPAFASPWGRRRERGTEVALFEGRRGG